MKRSETKIYEKPIFEIFPMKKDNFVAKNLGHKTYLQFFKMLLLQWFPEKKRIYLAIRIASRRILYD